MVLDATVTAKNSNPSNGATAFQVALTNCHVDAVRVLVDAKGVKIDEMFITWEAYVLKTALVHAIDDGHKGIELLFRERGAEDAYLPEDDDE